MPICQPWLRVYMKGIKTLEQLRAILESQGYIRIKNKVSVLSTVRETMPYLVGREPRLTRTITQR